MRFDLLRSPFRSKVTIAYVFPQGLVLSGIPEGEDPARSKYSVSVEARRTHLAGLTYLAQIAPGLFSYRFDEAIAIDLFVGKVRVKVFKDSVQVASRTLSAGTVFGALDSAGGGEVRGWVCQAFHGVAPVIPELLIDGTHRIPIICSRYRMDLSPLTAGEPMVGFQIGLPASTRGSSIKKVALRVGDSVVATCNYTEAQNDGSHAKGNISGPAPDERDNETRIADIRRLKLEIRVARLQNDVARLQGMTQKLVRLRDPKVAAPILGPLSVTNAHENRNVSVIVPVYGDAVSLRRCIVHLLLSQAITPFELIVVNDCSPDADVRRYLKTLSGQRSITLMGNERNLGFVGSVNVGLQTAAPNNDVVLLNSDAFVPLRWLEKLSTIAHSEPNVASVTPLSNAATIFSYPRPNHDNPMPPGTEVDVLDERFSRSAEMLGYTSVEVPTGVGFCMYLTRQALDEVGGFAEEFSPGYGEENDWCKRAEDRGFRNLGATNTFVEHLGSASFSEKRVELIRSHMAILNAKYPEYMHEVSGFIEEDPFAVFRAAADLLEQLDGAKKIVIHLAHGWGGGIAEHVADITRLTSELALHIVASSDRHDSHFLNVRIGDSNLGNRMPTRIFLELIRKASDVLRLDPYVHFHSTIGMISRRTELVGLPGSLKVATIHDYSLRCPRVFLLTAGDRFCGLPDVETCERCIRMVGPLQGLEEEYAHAGSVPRWVADGEQFLSNMDRVTCPSADLRARFPFPPGVRSCVVPHPEEAIKPFAIVQPRRPLRVGILGAIGPHKGSREIRELAETIELRDLPIKLFIVGYTDDDKAFEERSSVIITGPYEKRNASVVLQSLALDFVLIPSIWPETYSFTVSEAWRSGLPVMTVFEGGHSDRVMAAQGFGYFPLRALQPDPFVEAILAFADELESRAGDILRPAVLSPSDWFEMTYA